MLCLFIENISPHVRSFEVDDHIHMAHIISKAKFKINPLISSSTGVAEPILPSFLYGTLSQ